MPKGTPPDPEKSALAALKKAEEEAKTAKQELDDERDKLQAKANEKAAAARLTEAKERVKTRWVLLVGEAIINEVVQPVESGARHRHQARRPRPL